jgi:hypothetical protein
MNQELHENRKVLITTVEEFEKFRESTKETPKDLFIGTIPTFNPLNELPPQARPNEFGPTEICDADGEVVSIKELNLVLAGSVAADELPPMRPEHMRDFCEAVAKTATWNQRNMPFYQKILLLFKCFCEIFFGKIYIQEEDPYIMVAARWYRKQQLPVPFKQRIRMFTKRLVDLFVYTKSAEPIDTYGMPGFQTFKSRTFPRKRVAA